MSETEEVYENQWWVTSEWRDSPKRSDSVAPWSDARGSPRDMDGIVLPAGWVWKSAWKVDMSVGAVDDQGWTYGPDFKYLISCVGQRSLNIRWSNPVRRRRWIRTRIRAEAHPGRHTAAVVQSGHAVPSRPGAGPAAVEAPSSSRREPTAPVGTHSTRRAEYMPRGSGAGRADDDRTGLREVSTMLADTAREIKGYDRLTSNIGSSTGRIQDNETFRAMVKHTESELMKRFEAMSIRIGDGLASAPRHSDEAAAWDRHRVNCHQLHTEFLANVDKVANRMRRTPVIHEVSARGAGAGSGGRSARSVTASRGSARPMAGGGAGAGAAAPGSSQMQALQTDSGFLGSDGRQMRVLASGEVEVQSAIIEEREAEIERICSEVHELQDMFQEVGWLVEKQGEGVKKIGENVTVAEDRTKKGVEELEKALEYQKKTCVVM